MRQKSRPFLLFGIDIGAQSGFLSKFLKTLASDDGSWAELELKGFEEQRAQDPE
jgi:hypothetical protein